MKLSRMHSRVLGRSKQRGFLMLGDAGSVAGNFPVQRSVRLRSAASAYFSRTPSVAGNRKTWTLSGWVKLGALSSSEQIFSAENGVANYTVLQWNAGVLEVHNGVGGVGASAFATSAVYRDPAAWYHITLAVDTAQAAIADRVKLYVNGVLQLWGTNGSTAFDQNRDTWVNGANLHRIGKCTLFGGNYLDTYLSEFYFIDGQALTPSSFGQTDPATGQWVAKKYTGTYGTNGFYLDFSDITSTTTLGYDKSGNGNNWTANNISLTAGVTYDSMLDVPAGNAWADGGNGRGNYATLNPLVNNGLFTLLNSNNYYSYATVGWSTICGTQALLAGKYYFEVSINTVGTETAIGILNAAAGAAGNIPDYSYRYTGEKGTGTSFSAYGAAYAAGDIVGVAFDSTTGALSFYKNGVSQGVAFTVSTSTLYVPAIGVFGTVAASGHTNFGQRPFAYTPPNGFKALHTGNLPEPAIKLPKLHHNVYLVTKSGNTNFTLDWDASVYDTLFWIKRRDAVGDWYQVDGLSGYDKILKSNSTAAETTDANVIGVSGTTITLKSTLPDGTYEVLAWKAGLTASRQTNTDGTITSTVSRNVTSGFSIISYQGNGAAGATVGHGLGNVPALTIYKARGLPTGFPAGGNWLAWHKSVGQSSFQASTTIQLNGFTGALYLNGTNATSTYVFDNQINGSGTFYVAYCFAEISQYSKFGSYPGNGSADGPNPWLGFLSNDLTYKRTDTTGNWNLVDAKRNPYNQIDVLLRFNLTAADETNAVYAQDFVAGSWKIRSTNVDINAASSTQVFWSFAQAPFKYANAR